MALRARRLAHSIVGLGRNRGRLQVARDRGIIDQACGSIDEAVAGADLVVVATPVDRIADLVIAASAHAAADALITDVGSTKRAIVERVEGEAPKCPFVGSHPLAGKTSTGCRHAEADLFAGRTVFVTPGRATPAERVAAACALWEGLDARVELVEPERHDAIVATTSHLPHVVAVALAKIAPPSWPSAYFGSGWRTTTRLAEGDVDMWLAILRQNRAAVAAALRETGEQLEAWCTALEADDAEQLAEWLLQGKQQRERLGS